jgi:hypothetical protein
MLRRIAALVVALAIAVALAAFAYKVASEPPGPMQPEDFARSVRQLASLARETAFLCEQIQEDRLTAPFARTHREKLEGAVRDEAEQLGDAAPPGLADAASQARELAAQLAANLKEMRLHLAEAEVLQRIRGDTRRIGEAVERLEPR